MTEGWRVARWSDLAALEYGKALRDYRENGGPVRVFGSNGPIGWTDEQMGSGPAVIVGRKGAYRGVEYWPGPFYVIDTAFWLRPLQEIDLRWAYYQLRTQDINGLDSGSAIPSLGRGDFGAMRVAVPPLDVQAAIGDVLSSIDEKIEANEDAQKPMEGLIAALYARLMSEASSATPVQLRSIASLTKGVGYKSADLEPSSTALVSLKAFGRTGGYKREGLKPFTGPYKSGQVVQTKDSVVDQTDLTQNAEVVGRTIRVSGDVSFETLVASMDACIVRPSRDGLTPEFLFAVLSSEGFRQHCRARANGTTVLHLPLEAVQSFVLDLPDDTTVQRLTELIRPLWAQADALALEAHKLQALGEALLPEIVSGRRKVRVTGSTEA